MSNFDITELLRDGQMNRQRNGKVGTCVAKSGGQGLMVVSLVVD